MRNITCRRRKQFPKTISHKAERETERSLLQGLRRSSMLGK